MMKQKMSLSDCTFSPPEWDDDGFLDIKVYWKHIRHEVAYVHCRQHPSGILELEDIVVNTNYELPHSRFRRVLGRSAKVVSFQEIGIGSKLLEMVIAEARTARVATIWGSIVETDPVRLNRLLRWYRSRDFRVEEPDDRCLLNAVKQVVLGL